MDLDLQEAGRAEAGRVAEQRGCRSSGRAGRGASGGRKAQAAWTWPQQNRCGPRVASQAPTSSAFLIRLGCELGGVGRAGRRPGNGRRRSAAGGGSRVGQDVAGHRRAGRAAAAPWPRGATGSGRGRGSRSRRRCSGARGTSRTGRSAPKVASNCRVRTDPVGVSVVVAGDHGGPAGSLRRSERASRASSNSAERAVVVRSPVIRTWSALRPADPLDHGGQPLQAELAWPGRPAGWRSRRPACSAGGTGCRSTARRGCRRAG